MSQIEAALRTCLQAMEAAMPFCMADAMKALEPAIAEARAALSQQSPAPSPEPAVEFDRLWKPYGIDGAALASPAPSVEPPDQVHSAQATNEGKESWLSVDLIDEINEALPTVGEPESTWCMLRAGTLRDILAASIPQATARQDAKTNPEDQV